MNCTQRSQMRHHLRAYLPVRSGHGRRAARIEGSARTAPGRSCDSLMRRYCCYDRRSPGCGRVVRARGGCGRCSPMRDRRGLPGWAVR
jgi:hypothetical protein